MPNPCRISVELQGSEPYENGLPTRYAAVGRASRNCTRIRVIVRVTSGGTTIFEGFADTAYQQLVPGTADLDPQNDGTFRVEFPPWVVGLPCGLELWVDAACVGGTGGCGFHAACTIICKNHPDRPSPDEYSQPGSEDDTDDDTQGGPRRPWVWDPPAISCPRFGKTFLQLLLLGLTLLAVGASMFSPVAMVASAAAFAAAGVLYAIWQHWCTPNDCYFWGGILWVLKRATLAAAGLAIVNLSLGGWLVTIAYGILGGWTVLRLQRNHCDVPSGRTPLNQLPLF